MLSIKFMLIITAKIDTTNVSLVFLPIIDVVVACAILRIEVKLDSNLLIPSIIKSKLITTSSTTVSWRIHRSN